MEYLLPVPAKSVSYSKHCTQDVSSFYADLHWGHTGMSPSICSGIFFWAPHHDLPIYARNHLSPLLKLMHTLLTIYQKL